MADHDFSGVPPQVLQILTHNPPYTAGETMILRAYAASPGADSVMADAIMILLGPDLGQAAPGAAMPAPPAATVLAAPGGGGGGGFDGATPTPRAAPGGLSLSNPFTLDALAPLRHLGTPTLDFANPQGPPNAPMPMPPRPTLGAVRTPSGAPMPTPPPAAPAAPGGGITLSNPFTLDALTPLSQIGRPTRDFMSPQATSAPESAPMPTPPPPRITPPAAPGGGEGSPFDIFKGLGRPTGDFWDGGPGPPPPPTRDRFGGIGRSGGAPLGAAVNPNARADMAARQLPPLIGTFSPNSVFAGIADEQIGRVSANPELVAQQFYPDLPTTQAGATQWLSDVMELSKLGLLSNTPNSTIFDKPRSDIAMLSQVEALQKAMPGHGGQVDAGAIYREAFQRILNSDASTFSTGTGGVVGDPENQTAVTNGMLAAVAPFVYEGSRDAYIARLNRAQMQYLGDIATSGTSLSYPEWLRDHGALDWLG